MSRETVPDDDQAVQPQFPEGVKDVHRQLPEPQCEAEQLRVESDQRNRGRSRRRLPNTRRSVTHKFRVGTHEGYMTVGLYDDGRPGELFLTMAKEGSTIGGLMDTIGILTSLALQYGVPVEALARKFEHVNFEPSGWTPDLTIRRASSVIDYIFRWLGLQFSETYRQEQLAVCSQRVLSSEHANDTTAVGQSEFWPPETGRVSDKCEELRS